VERLSSRFDANASFEVTAREFHATKKVGWSDHYAKRWMERLEKDIFPWLGKLPLSQIGAPMLLQTLRRVEARGTRELPHSLLEACGQVFRYGVATGRCERSPTSDLRGALKPVLTRHVSAIVEPDQVGDLMRAIDGYHGLFLHDSQRVGRFAPDKHCTTRGQCTRCARGQSSRRRRARGTRATTATAGQATRAPPPCSMSAVRRFTDTPASGQSPPVARTVRSRRRHALRRRRCGLRRRSDTG